jgi:aminoglycoside phosphotransferase (APT) family kinase protein
MQERLAEVPRAARRLVPGWLDCLATDVLPLAGASGCAFRLRSVANGTFFVRLLRSSVSRDSRLVGVTRTAAAAGLTPAVVGADAEAMVQEWVEGRAPDPQEFCEPARARRLGEFIAKMHALPDAPTTGESRAAAAASAAAVAATGLSQTTSLTHTSVGVSVVFDAPQASSCVDGSGLRCSWSAGCEFTSPLATTRAAADSVGMVHTRLPRAVYGPLQRNGVDCSEFELAWRAAEAFQAEQLTRPSIVSLAGAMVWSHGDLHLHNLLQADVSPESTVSGEAGGSDSRLLCIDLETVALRPASSDLTNLLRFWRFPDLATRRALVEGYISQQAQNKSALSGATASAVDAAHPATIAGPSHGGSEPPEGRPPRGQLGPTHLVSDESINATLWAIECCMPVCLTRWIVAVMTAPDAMGGDPSAPRVRQAMHFVPVLAPAVAALREAASIGAEHKRQCIIANGVWATVGLPPLEQVFCE